jgi:DNA integrity scanning protein DisA with diadenylate cyclase activity
MKSSRVISYVSMELISNVSENVSVSVIRDWLPENTSLHSVTAKFSDLTGLQLDLVTKIVRALGLHGDLDDALVLDVADKDEHYLESNSLK